MNWEVSDTEFSTEGVFHGFSSLAFKDTLTGFAGGTIFPFEVLTDQTTSLVKTTDGGVSWTAVESVLPISPSTLVYVPQSDDKMLFITSPQGAAMSNDGGVTWQILNTMEHYALSFASPTAGWASGLPEGNILKFTGIQPVGLNQPNIPVLGFELMQNHPNPFSHSTIIRYALPNSDYVTLKVFDLTGKVVESLVNGFQLAGEHQVEWLPKDLPGGVYFYQLQGGETSESKKLILQR
jgi:hypothetical protein